MALKKTSEVISIGARIVESAANTYTEERVDLQLNPLDNEVFIVVGVNLDAQAPDALAGINTAVSMTMTATSAATPPGLNSSSCLAKSERTIRAAGFVDGGVGFDQSSFETPPSSDLPYLGIIATNDFFLQILGANNAGAKIGVAKIYGYRAKADAATYAALVQSEVLSS
jgi:hypothetical protein